MAQFADEELRDNRVAELRRSEEEDLAKILSKKYQIPYADLSRITIDTDGLRMIEEEEARSAKIAVFDLIGKRVRVAVLAPGREDTKAVIKSLEDKGFIIEPFMVSTQSLVRAWERYKEISYASNTKEGMLEISSKDIENFINAVHKIEDVKALIEEIVQMKKSFRISRIVEIIMAGAISLGASDVHIEPEKDYIQIRFRLDGVLIEVTKLDPETYHLLLSRIKLLSGMKLNIKETAQDGRFSITIGEREIEIRSSTLPGNYGESVVMRLLDPASIQVKLEDLGVSDKLMKIFMDNLARPNGMILNTGPTGSGKTTTLYSFIRLKKTPEIKIITIEDPIEYHLDGIVQTQVDNEKGYDFATGLKKTLRQDPDVIMVGEIRDLETAETAVHAALTGHLVFSTLHTNNAAGTFTRLIDLGVNPKILTSAISMAIAQRLVRRLCEFCREEFTPQGEDLALMKSVYESIKEKEVAWTDKSFKAKVGGCEKCNNSGYKGRIAVFEAVLSDQKVEEALESNPSEREIKESAEHQGIMDMAQDGVTKILQGHTDLDELKRVVDLSTRSGLGDAKDGWANEDKSSEKEEVFDASKIVE
ncbi:MAG: type II/IV secretion system protein [Candidatus Pacebacteria bacterium]|nr:type II/IV secretion system protein [Candidatus Paceibacterota bacterium]